MYVQSTRAWTVAAIHFSRRCFPRLFLFALGASALKWRYPRSHYFRLLSLYLHLYLFVPCTEKARTVSSPYPPRWDWRQHRSKRMRIEAGVEGRADFGCDGTLHIHLGSFQVTVAGGCIVRICRECVRSLVGYPALSGPLLCFTSHHIAWAQPSRHHPRIQIMEARHICTERSPAPTLVPARNGLTDHVCQLPFYCTSSPFVGRATATLQPVASASKRGSASASCAAVSVSTRPGWPQQAPLPALSCWLRINPQTTTMTLSTIDHRQ